jgi:membrane protease YdiL (CAAX protease family)
MHSTGLRSLFVSRGRLRSGWRAALYLGGYLLGLLATQIPLGILYVVYLTSTGVADIAGLQAALQPDRLPLWLYLAFKVGELFVLLPLTYAASRWLDRRRFVALGFGTDRGTSLDLFLGLALGGVQMLAITGIEWAGGWLSVQFLGGEALLRALVDALLAFALFVLVALGEELMFRGYLQVNLQEGTTPLLALLLTSLLFGVFHALNPNFSWLALANIVLAGLVLGYGRLVMGSLWLPMAYHFSWNLSQGVVFGLPVSGVRYGGLIKAVDQGTARWLTGASFGPEGGLIGTAVLLAAFPVLWLWGRWRQRVPSPVGGQT